MDNGGWEIHIGQTVRDTIVKHNGVDLKDRVRSINASISVDGAFSYVSIELAMVAVTVDPCSVETVEEEGS